MTRRILTLTLAVGILSASLVLFLPRPAAAGVDGISVTTDRTDYAVGMTAIATADLSYGGPFADVDRVRFGLNDASGVPLEVAYVTPTRVDNRLAQATYDFPLRSVSELAYVKVSVNGTVASSPVLTALATIHIHDSAAFAIVPSLAVVLTATLIAVPIARRRRRMERPGFLPTRAGFISLEPRGSYLLSAERPNEAFQLFERELARGSKGIVVTRLYPQDVRRKFRVGTSPVLWLSRGFGRDARSASNLGWLAQEIERFMTGKEDSIVLLDGLEYLIMQNDFQEVMRFVQTVRNAIGLHGSRLLLTVNLKVFDEAKRALLTRDLRLL